MRRTGNDKYCLPTEGDADNFVASLAADGIPCVALLQHFHRLRASEELGDHVHRDCVEFIFCVRGSFGFHGAGRSRTVRAGEIMVVPSGTRHHIAAHLDNLVYHDLTVRLDTPRPILNLPRAEADCLHAALAGLKLGVFRPDPDVPRLFRRLVRTCREQSPSPERSLQLRALVLPLLLRLVEPARGRGATSATPDERLLQIVEEIRRDPGARRNLDALAERTGMSYSKFNTAFKKATGLPPHAFVLSERLARARALAARGKSAADIYAALGFASPRHLITKFKRAYNTTPGRMKKNA